MAKTEKKQRKADVAISLTDMTVSELTAKSKLLTSEIIKKRLDKSVGRLKNVREIFNLRKQLARVKTMLHIKMRLDSVKS